MQLTKTHYNWQHTAIFTLLTLLVLRLLAMWAIPLTDATEARYAEIARKMLETGNWVTPLFDYNQPFWAKPPLSTWLSAAAMGLFGVNAFSARLPNLLLSLATLWLIWDLAVHRSGREAGTAAALLLTSSVLFLGASGTVMTDPALMFCVALSQVAFWRAMSGSSLIWRYGFFIGLALGLLAKGPLAIVLVGMPIFVWILVSCAWKSCWQRLPWISGTLLMLLIALPWYLWAEQRTPGFLHYFIMGEHVSRFLHTGWHGDKYGFAHATPRGMIWLYALGAIFPWSIAMFGWLVRNGKQAWKLRHDHDGWLLYTFLWMVMTLLFFSLSGNIIFPYSLPMLPGFALFAAELWVRTRQAAAHSNLPRIALLSALLLLVATGLAQTQGARYFQTQKPIITAWEAQRTARDQYLIYWDSRREFSAEFYGQGKIQTTNQPETLRNDLDTGKARCLVTAQHDLPSLPQDIHERLTTMARILVVQDHMLLLCERNRI